MGYKFLMCIVNFWLGTSRLGYSRLWPGCKVSLLVWSISFAQNRGPCNIWAALPWTVAWKLMLLSCPHQILMEPILTCHPSKLLNQSFQCSKLDLHFVTLSTEVQYTFHHRRLSPRRPMSFTSWCDGPQSQIFPHHPLDTPFAQGLTLTLP